MNNKKRHSRLASWAERLPKLRTWQAILLQMVLILIFSAVVMVLAVQTQPNQLSFMIEQFVTQPLLILLNFLPVFVIMVFFASLLGNVFYGAAVTELVVCGFSLASRIKCDIRQEPLYPRDLSLLREVGEAVKSYHINFPIKIIAVLLAFAAALVVLGVILPRLIKQPVGLRGLVRWLHSGISVAVALILVFTLYNSNDVYNSFSGTSYFNPLGAYNDLGSVYSFCHYLTTNSVDKPEGFQEEEAAAWDSEDVGDASSLPVNVVVVMNETFTDLVDNAAFTYAPEDDPIAFYHSMIAREDVLSGRLVVMNLGGGTANTEFDVMTGIRSDSLSEGTTVAFRTIDGNMDSIFRAYQAVGYRTSYIHPGHLWFYNRYHIMPWLGAETTIFSEDLEDPEMLGGYVSDDYTADLLIEQFEADTADGSLAFNYTTTIQNHMNYTLDKYGEDYDIPALQCDAELTEERETELAVYVEGLRYADASLQKLVSYFETCGKPVLFVFFGDHYPYLGADNDGFWQLGMEGDNKEYDFSLYEPPFFLWANDEAKEILDWDKAAEALELPKQMSACYLGGTIMELTGLSESSPWYSYVNSLRRELPVVWHNEYMDSKGNVLFALEPPDAEKIKKWHQWAYYRMLCKEIEN